ncbi:hypothetical protein HYZ64_00235 [Candidatus Berkelbacteria bacterium]|nr:hypothetical protein [Candidatus Berkelbacteria bacterium]
MKQLGLILLFVFLPVSVARADTTAALRPVADGGEDSASWTNTAAAACSAADCSAEVKESSGASCTNSDGDTSYVESNVNAARQTFKVGLSSIPDNSTITQIDITVCARKTTTGAANTFQTRRCVDATCASFGTNLTTGTAYAESTQSHSGLSIAKTASTTIDIGAEVTGSVTNKVRLSQISALISYTPPSTPTPTPTPTSTADTSTPATTSTTTTTTPTVAEPSVPPATSSPSPQSTTTEQPQKVTRVPVPSKILPAKPELRVPLYPDQNRWYNQAGEPAVIWNVPNDIKNVAVALDGNPNTVPSNLEPELLTGKKFGVLKEGVWYVHVRFKNNVGFGDTAHYKIQLDTTPPLAFAITIDNPSSDNPSPTIKFETQDSLSGIGEIHLFLKDFDVIKTTEKSYTMPPQPPGKRVVVVRIFDQAGNSTDSRLEFEIIPLPSPVIEFISKTVTHGEFILIAGKSLPSSFVDLFLITKDGKILLKQTAATDETGRWSHSIRDPVRVGTYHLTATARDRRGALSYPTDPVEVKVRAKPVLAIGALELTWPHIFIIVLLLFGSASGLGGAYYLARQRTLQAYRTIASRDVQKMADLMDSDLGELIKRLKTLPVTRGGPGQVEVSLYLKKLLTTVSKIRKYLPQEIDKLK